MTFSVSRCKLAVITIEKSTVNNEATLKSKQPFPLSCILSPPSSHVTYLAYQDTAYQSSELVCQHLSLS